MDFVENSLINIWNALSHRTTPAGLNLGFLVNEGRISRKRIALGHHRRSQHISIVGKTGTGKSSLLKYFMSQDIAAGRGFICIDLHGDLVPFVLATITFEEERTGTDLSDRLLFINPADPHFAVGLNLIDCQDAPSISAPISEMVSLLKSRWSLEHFGARTEELLRNCLWVLCENKLTLLELTPLLTDSTYRLSLLRNVKNPEVKAFFKERYDRASEAMQAVMREAVLNKITTFTVDPAIRHIVGQSESSVSLSSAIDQGFWILLNLNKASLGDNALTFAGLFITKLKTAIFRRASRALFSLYADELPNLVAAGNTLETLLSEARKFAVSVVSANQFLNQFTSEMKSALFSVGTQICFQVSAEDAPLMARVLDGEHQFVRRLRTLGHRHLAAKLGELPQEIYVPAVQRPEIDSRNLIGRASVRFAKPRHQIEDEINARRPTIQTKANLEGWD